MIITELYRCYEILIERESLRTVVACAELNPRGLPGRNWHKGGGANSYDVGVEIFASS